MKRQPLNYRLNVIGLAVSVFLILRNVMPSLLKLTDIMTLKIILGIIASVVGCIVPAIIIEKMCEYHPALFTKPHTTLSSKDKSSIIGSNMLAFIGLRVLNGLLITIPFEKIGIRFPRQKMPELYSFTEYFLYFIMISIVPAFVEEIFLRGMVMNSLLPYGRHFAIITSAFVFMMMHTTVQSYPAIFAMGIILGCIYLYTGDIRMNMLMHFVNNTYSFLIMFMQSNVNGISALSFAGFLILLIIGFGAGSFVWLYGRKVSIYSILKARDNEAKFTQVFKSPVMMLAFIGCLIVARAETYRGMISQGLL